MTDPRPDARPDTRAEGPPGMPRWVKVAAIVVGLLILIIVILQLTGLAGDHGPGMHSSLGQPSASATELLPAPR
jgi:hypothetical protein